MNKEKNSYSELLAICFVFIMVYGVFFQLQNGKEKQYEFYGGIKIPKEVVNSYKASLSKTDLKNYTKENITVICANKAYFDYAIIKEAQSLGFTVAKQQIYENIFNDSKFLVDNLYNKEKFEAFLKDHDLVEPEYYKYVECKLLLNQYNNFIKESYCISEVKKKLAKKNYNAKRHIKYGYVDEKYYKIHVKDEELLKYFEENKEKFLIASEFEYEIYKEKSSNSIISKYIADNNDLAFFEEQKANYQLIDENDESYYDYKQALDGTLNQNISHDEVIKKGNFFGPFKSFQNDHNILLLIKKDVLLNCDYKKVKEKVKKAYILEKIKNTADFSMIDSCKSIVLSGKTKRHNMFTDKILDELFVSKLGHEVVFEFNKKIMIAYVDFIDFDKSDEENYDISDEMNVDLLNAVHRGVFEHERDSKY